MELLTLKILITLALAVFALGICTIVLRKNPIWTIVGQIMAFKGITFGAFVLISVLRAKMELLTILLYSSLFFMVIFSLVGFGLLIRSRRMIERI